MKQIYLIIFSVVFAFQSINAQVARQYVLLEQANNTSMPTCSYFVPITSDIENNVSNVTVASYHDMDYFYCAESAARLQDMYGTEDSEYPAFWVDGVRVPYSDAVSGLQAAVEARNNVQSNFSIELTETHTGSNYAATVVLTKEAEFTNTNMVMRLILKEKNIYYDWTGWEGETVETVDNVVRAIIPTESGSPVDLSNSSTQTFNLNFTLDSEWDKDNCELIAYIQDTETGEVLQATNLSLREILYNNDAGLYDVIAPDKSVCDNTISPIIILKNKGGENLTSLTITYSVDSEADMTYNWTGNLAFNEREEITLPAYTYTQNYNVSKTITCTCSNPNGVTDENAANDVISSDFTQTMYSSNQLFFELKTDDHGEDTSWELFNSSGTVVASGNGYSNATLYNETINLTATDCYTFKLYDAYGDGIAAPGYYTLKDESGNLIAENGFFNSEESTEFNATVSLSVKELDNNKITVFPNPSNNGRFYITNAENCDIIIYDLLGKIVYNKHNNSKERVCVENINKGSYIINISNKISSNSYKMVITE